MFGVADRHSAFPVGEGSDGSRGEGWEDSLELFDDATGVFGVCDRRWFVFGERDVEGDGFIEGFSVEVTVVDDGENRNVFAHGAMKEDTAPGGLIFEDWLDIAFEGEGGESRKCYALIDRMGDDDGIGFDGALRCNDAMGSNRGDGSFELDVYAAILELFCHRFGER